MLERFKAQKTMTDLLHSMVEADDEFESRQNAATVKCAERSFKYRENQKAK